MATPPNDLVTPPSDLVSEVPTDLVSPPNDLVSEEPKRPTAADIPDDSGRKVVPKEQPEPSLLDKITAPFETAVGLVGGMGASLVGQVAGVAAGVVTGDLGKHGGRGEQVAEKVTNVLSPTTTNPVAQDQLEQASVLMRESGITGLMPGMHPAVPSLGKGSFSFIKQAISKEGKAPILEAVFRNKENNTITSSGTKHNEAFKEANKDTHEAGFVDTKGEFLSRKEAATRAKEIGQIPKDHKLEIPEEGLHSGDLKQAAKEKELSGIPLGQRVNKLADDLYALRGNRTADKIEMQNRYNDLSAETKTETAYHAMPTEAEEGKSLKDFPELAKLNEEHKQAYEEAVRVEKGKIPEELNTEHNPRNVQRTLLDKIKTFGSNVMGGGGFGRKAGSQRARSMFALEKADGTREVINVDSNKVSGYADNKLVKTPIYRGKEAVKVGDVLPNGSKVVEATTKEIEAQTDLSYNKDAAANILSSISELKAYTREAQFLKEVLPSLEEAGMALKKSSVTESPKGWKSGEGHPSLDKYWFAPRIANVFEDSILNGGKEGTITSALEMANSASVGTLFWNPFPHVFNAFDHYVNTIGWGFFKPWEYPSIAKSMVDAYKDVKNVSPEYRQYLREGWGLQYGNVIAERGIQQAIEHIPPADLADMAKAWGMKPADLVGAIYSKSKSALWGSSDIFMIAARKNMANKQGMDIFNKAIGNYIEAHNPNYRVAANVGFDALMKIPKMQETMANAISRNISKLMQSRAFNTFGRYHYGQFKSLGTNMHDSIFQNEKSVQSRGQALSNSAFTAFNVAVVYPYVWDTLAKMMTNDPTAEQRRSGAATIPYTVWHMILGDKDVTRLIQEAFALPPVTKTIVEEASNRQLFTGKQIWNPQDTLVGKAYEAGKYGVQQTIAPVRQIGNVMGDKGQKEALAQFGITIKEDKTILFTEQQIKQERARLLKLQKERGF